MPRGRAAHPRHLVALLFLSAALFSSAALASAPPTASPALGTAELASPSLALERTLASEELPPFPLFSGDELELGASRLSSLTRTLPLAGARESRFHALNGVQPLDEDLVAQLAQDLHRSDELSYPKTRIGGLRLFEQDLYVVSTPLSVEVRWGCGDFSWGNAEDIGVNLYAFVGQRPHEKTDPLGLYVETPIDLLSLGMDIVFAGIDLVKEGKVSNETRLALTADLVTLALPGAAGGGFAVHATAAGARAASAVNKARLAKDAALAASKVPWLATHMSAGHGSAAGNGAAGGGTGTASGSPDTPKMASSHTRGGAGPVRTGQRGEGVGTQVTGLKKNTRRIPSASGKREYRVPDHMTSDGRYIAEDKAVKKQHLSSQILDDKAYVQRDGGAGRVDVLVDDSTEITTPLLREHLNPGSPVKVRTAPLKAELPTPEPPIPGSSVAGE